MYSISKREEYLYFKDSYLHRFLIYDSKNVCMFDFENRWSKIKWQVPHIIDWRNAHHWHWKKLCVNSRIDMIHNIDYHNDSYAILLLAYSFTKWRFVVLNYFQKKIMMQILDMKQISILYDFKHTLMLRRQLILTFSLLRRAETICRQN